MSLKFALAVNHDNQFEEKHFGDADKYLIYEIKDDEIVFLSEEDNGFKNLDEEVEHGSKRKGKAIVEFLKSKKVSVLVSRQFGKNIKLVNEYFIPVIVSAENPEQALGILSRHIYWMEDEWKNKKHAYKLFTIKAAILKTSINK
jgi:predicted Fe-Mo cluster-binding NifX family protein